MEAGARLARPFRCVAALSGGLLGTGETGTPPQTELYGHAEKSFDYGSRLDAVPVLLGCHESDPHIPLNRVHKSADVLGAMGAKVDTTIIPGAGHGIVEDEAVWLRRQLSA